MGLTVSVDLTGALHSLLCVLDPCRHHLDRSYTVHVADREVMIGELTLIEIRI